MATPRSQGRMIRVSIAEDAGINRLSDGAARLYFMLKPHLNSHGKFSGGPHVIRENVVPLLPWSAKRINGYLVEINNHTSVRVWNQFGRFYVHDLAFSSEQDLRDDRKGRDSLPEYPGADRMKAGTSKYSLPEYLPDLLPHEVEVEEEREVEVESEAIRALPSPPPGGCGAAAPQDRGNGKGASNGAISEPNMALILKAKKEDHQLTLRGFLAEVIAGSMGSQEAIYQADRMGCLPRSDLELLFS